MRELAMATFDTLFRKLDPAIHPHSRFGVLRTQQAVLEDAQMVHLLDHVRRGLRRDVIIAGSFLLPRSTVCLRIWQLQPKKKLVSTSVCHG